MMIFRTLRVSLILAALLYIASPSEDGDGGLDGLLTALLADCADCPDVAEIEDVLNDAWVRGESVEDALVRILDGREVVLRQIRDYLDTLGRSRWSVR
jgi:hypothetical protein